LSQPTVARGQPARGLGAERTTLAWTRTSFAFLINGTLLSLKYLHGIDVRGLIPAGLALAAAACTYLIAMQRQRTLAQRPIPANINPRRQVYIVGVSAIVLVVVTLVAQMI
jgi:uncharacterized membrane protein YidH (DUF202 family)